MNLIGYCMHSTRATAFFPHVTYMYVIVICTHQMKEQRGIETATSEAFRQLEHQVHARIKCFVLSNGKRKVSVFAHVFPMLYVDGSQEKGYYSSCTCKSSHDGPFTDVFGQRSSIHIITQKWLYGCVYFMQKQAIVTAILQPILLVCTKLTRPSPCDVGLGIILTMPGRPQWLLAGMVFKK